MESITSLTSRLSERYALEYPGETLLFVEGADFEWNHNSRTIHYDPHDPNAEAFLLHEFSHAKLGHKEYSRDVELITMERDAWHQASLISAEFGVDIPQELVEDSLDSYRDWLHARSTCPTCSATGLQTGASEYTCLACRQKWKVNLAKHKELRRYKK